MVEDGYVPRGGVDRRDWEKNVPEKCTDAPIALQLTGALEG